MRVCGFVDLPLVVDLTSVVVLALINRGDMVIVIFASNSCVTYNQQRGIVVRH